MRSSPCHFPLLLWFILAMRVLLWYYICVWGVRLSNNVTTRYIVYVYTCTHWRVCTSLESIRGFRLSDQDPSLPIALLPLSLPLLLDATGLRPLREIFSQRDYKGSRDLVQNPGKIPTKPGDVERFKMLYFTMCYSLDTEILIIYVHEK